jgi:hypothetical protein
MQSNPQLSRDAVWCKTMPANTGVRGVNANRTVSVAQGHQLAVWAEVKRVNIVCPKAADWIRAGKVPKLPSAGGKPVKREQAPGAEDHIRIILQCGEPSDHGIIGDPEDRTSAMHVRAGV